MESAIAEGDCDVVGLGRPLCTEPDLPRRLLSGEADEAVAFEHRLKLAERGWRSPTSRFLPMRVMNVLGAQGWYYQQIFRLADCGAADLELGMGSAAWAYLKDELATARCVHQARKRG
jgi:hypothetical protein